MYPIGSDSGSFESLAVADPGRAIGSKPRTGIAGAFPATTKGLMLLASLDAEGPSSDFNCRSEEWGRFEGVVLSARFHDRG